MELVVKILEHLNEREEISVIQDLSIDGYSRDAVAYHVRRMHEAGLLDAEVITSSTTPTRLINVLPFGLSWEGHEFLDAVRHKGVWAKLKTKAKDLGGDLPFTLLKELALVTLRTEMGLHGMSGPR
jgi:hypothetical protein